MNLEKHYTIKLLAERMSMSYERTRQLVMHEPGVLVLPSGPQNGKRTLRKMYRIPESVVERIIRRNTTR